MLYGIERNGFVVEQTDSKGQTDETLRPWGSSSIAKQKSR